MRLVYGDDERVAAWAAAEMGAPAMARMGAPFVRPYTAIGIESDGGLAGAMIFNAFTGPDIELSTVGRHVWSRRSIEAAFAYVFGQLKCDRVSITIRADAPDHERLAKRLGFTREGYRPDKFGTGKDAIVMGMLRRQCRWLKESTT